MSAILLSHMPPATEGIEAREASIGTSNMDAVGLKEKDTQNYYLWRVGVPK